MVVGCSRRKFWDETRLKDALLQATQDLSTNGTMPTAKQLRTLPEGNALACAIVRFGGFDLWADRLSLTRSEHASRVGWRAEEVFVTMALARGLCVEERTRVKSAHDVIVNGRSVDVKVANSKEVAGYPQWTWRINRESHACQFYALFACNEEERQLLIVPAAHVPLTCFSMRGGERSLSGRSTWFDRWDFLK